MSPRSLIKVFLVNLTILGILLLCGEFGFRLLRFARSCKITCDFSYLSIITSSQRNKWSHGISRFSQVLGYEPNSDLNLVINAVGWKDIKVSTDSNGFRNSNPNPAANFKILTVGDSYTFGDQVSDSDTWQACLNKRFKDYEFVNAGVFGYGTHQALLRSQEIIKENPYKYVILQTLVGENFKRDQLDIRSGFVKPYLKKSNGNIVLSPPPPRSTPNTKYGPPEISLADYLLANIRLLEKVPQASGYHFNAFSKVNGTINRRGIDSATIEEIIEQTVNSSTTRSMPFIWLLQYRSKVDQNTLNERKIIISKLKSKNIAFIDTFNVLHISKMYSKDQLWRGHHTPLGNKIVCQEIASHLESL